MSVAAGLMSVRAVGDRRDGFSGEQPLPSSLGKEVVFCVHPMGSACPVSMQHDLNDLVSILHELHGPVSIQHDLSDLVSILHDPVSILHNLHGPVSILWDLHGSVSIQHDRFGSVSVRWGLCGPRSIQHGLFGPVSIQHGLGGCVYVQWDPCGPLSLEDGTGAPWLSSAGLGWVQPPLSLCSSSLGAPPTSRQTSGLRNHPGFSCPSQCWLEKPELPKRTSEASVPWGSFLFSGVHRVGKVQLVAVERLELQPGEAQGQGGTSPR